MAFDPRTVLVTGAGCGIESVILLDALHHERQAAFLRQMALEDLVPAPPWGAVNEESR